MTGNLTKVATGGLIAAAALLTVGIALTGQDWAYAGTWLNVGQSSCGPKSSGSEQITMPFTAGNSMTIALPASVYYKPGDKTEAIVSGDPALLAHVRMEGDRISLNCEPGWFASRLDIRLSGPAIADWKVLGSGDLDLSQINQPELSLSIRGSGSITATGTAQTVGLEISGSGSGELRQLIAQSARVEIRGSGDAQITAQADADVSISGSGDVELHGKPAMRRSEIRGSGSITQVP